MRKEKFKITNINNIPKSIQNKMHRLAKLSAEASRLSGEIDGWFTEHGYNVEEATSGDSLRSGSGLSLLPMFKAARIYVESLL